MAQFGPFCTCRVAPSSGTFAVSGAYRKGFFSLLNRWRNHLWESRSEPCALKVEYIYIHTYTIHAFVVFKKPLPKQSKPEDRTSHNQYRLKCLKHSCLNNFMKQLSTISTINHICVNHMRMVLEDNGNDTILKCGWEIQLGSRNNLNSHIYSIEKLSQNMGATAATDKWKQNYMSDGYQHEKSLGQFDFKWLTKTASQIAETNITKKMIQKILYFVWSPPWHLYILLLANLLAFYLTYFLAFDLAFYLAYLLAFYLTFYLAFYLAYLLAFYVAYLLTFYLAYLLALYVAYLLAWILTVEVRQGTLGVDGRGWGPAGNTGRGWSWLRSGREHWAGMVVVEVRQGTLGVDGRGWGPTENTARRGSQLSRRTRRTRRDEEGGRGGRGEEQATEIKSNNPHLAGGEWQTHDR